MWVLFTPLPKTIHFHLQYYCGPIARTHLEGNTVFSRQLLIQEIPSSGTTDIRLHVRYLILLQLVQLTKTAAIPLMTYIHSSNYITFLPIFVFLTNQTPEPSGSRWLISTCVLEGYRELQTLHYLPIHAFVRSRVNTHPTKNHSL